MVVSMDDIISMEYTIKLKLRNGKTIQLDGDPQEGWNMVRAAFSMAPNDSDASMQLPNDEDGANDYINHNFFNEEEPNHPSHEYENQ